MECKHEDRKIPIHPSSNSPAKKRIKTMNDWLEVGSCQTDSPINHGKTSNARPVEICQVKVEKNSEEQSTGSYEWWEDLERNSPSTVMCTKHKCSMTEEKHPFHPPPKKNSELSELEMRIILKWILKSGKISLHGSKNTYSLMRAQGYLAHRTDESLRNCFRRRILKNIQKFKLPKHIEERFIALRDK